MIDGKESETGACKRIGLFVLKESSSFKTKTLRGVHTVRGTVVLDGPERSEESPSVSKKQKLFW